MTETFRMFIARLEHRYGTMSAIAKAVGMSVSGFSRGVRIEGSLGTEKCLELAKWSGEPPLHVLRLAKKERTAELIEDLFGARDDLSSRAREVAVAWESLGNLELQDAYRLLILETASHLSAAKPTARHHQKRA